MNVARIDSQIFKTHSVQGASMTAAANAFVWLSTIMSMAEWSSASTFRTFYCKPLFNSDSASLICKVDLHVTSALLLLRIDLYNIYYII